ncbi:MAG: bacillithiol system redox-active protein YtxJ [Cytophagales bacterium]|nr:bacillithiol system redox-active protein YtxJ [Cytophagales bacterium]
MEWRKLENRETLLNIKEESEKKPVLIFKHSTRCSISSMAIDRLARSWKDDEINPHCLYYLDLIAYRSISNQIEEMFQVPHQSPQILIIKNGRCVYDNSHMGINYQDIKNKLAEVSTNN